jgi:predicted nucleic acid-binding protein
VHVPHVFDLEGVAPIRRHALHGRLSKRRAQVAIDGLRAERYSHVPLRARMWAYVARAEALDAPLVTVDAALAHASGVRAALELHPSP